MENKLLCYTGAATGQLLVSDCSCKIADALSSEGYGIGEDQFARLFQNIETAGLSLEERNRLMTEIEVDLFNTGTLVCSRLTHVPMPESMWPTKSAFEEAVASGNLSRASRAISVVGRQCYKPQVGITAVERTEKPPKMLPWEYRFTSSGASACTCPSRIEHRSESFPESSALATPYFANLFAHGLMNPDRTHPFQKGPVESGNTLDSCLFFRSGYSFVDADIKVTNPIIGGSSRSVNLTLNAASSSVPLWPGAGGADVETCGDESLSELSQFCFFGMTLDFDTQFFPTVEQINALSDICSNTEDTETNAGKQAKCCHKVQFQEDKDAAPPGEAGVRHGIIRLDLMRWTQCSTRPFPLVFGAFILRWLPLHFSSAPTRTGLVLTPPLSYPALLISSSPPPYLNPLFVGTPTRQGQNCHQQRRRPVPQARRSAVGS
jgi:hypothetical protein